MFTKLIERAGNAYFDHKSRKIKDRILVIESDDWGSIRTKNPQVRESLNQISPNVQADRYTQLDNLADSDDLNALYEVLSSVEDSRGNPACITANVCMANPDFDSIRKSNFDQFYYEPFNESIGKIHGMQTWALWQEGIEMGFLMPQLHGREHLHALQWLAELKAGNKELKKAFTLESFGIPYRSILPGRRKNLQAALDIYGLDGEEEFQENWIRESADLFEMIFGYHSKTFIPPAYTWHSRIDQTLQKMEVQAVQGIKLQYEPKKNGYRKRIHYTGQKSNELSYIVRNAFFEPVMAPEKDWVNIALEGIGNAFEKKQPAIVGSHRINFIGNLNEKNRTENLLMFRNVLSKVVEIYPEVQFMSSAELNNILVES